MSVPSLLILERVASSDVRSSANEEIVFSNFSAFQKRHLLLLWNGGKKESFKVI